MPELMLSDAITTDVTDETTAEAKPSARELMMEKIAADNIGRVKQDFDGLDEDTDIDNPDADQVALQQPSPEKSVVHKIFTVKVDGEERTVTDDELIRTYQKNAAADRRLEEATQLLRQAQEQAQQVQQVQAVPATESEPEFRAQVKDVLSKLYEGDEDKASAALADLLVKNRMGGDQPTQNAPNIDIDQLTARIQQKMDIDSAFSTIQADYPDLIADPDLEMLTAMKIDRAVAEGTPRAKAMLNAAAEVYKAVGKTSGRQTDPQKTAQSHRMENKQRLDLVKPASGVASQRATQSEENASDVIAEMASRRMGQSMPRRVA